MARMNTIGKTATKKYNDENGFFTVKYHATEVFKHKEENGKQTIVLNSGGWHTNTTKTRINQAFNVLGLPFALYQKAYSWYIRNTSTGEQIEFKDGLTLAI